MPDLLTPRLAGLTEDWLREVGFKWHQLDRQPDKHWLLWVGDLLRGPEPSLVCDEDLGIELAPSGLVGRDWWFCWLRSDVAHRYHRFLHIRHLSTQADLIQLFEGVTGHPWRPENHRWGKAVTAEQAALWDEREQRLDQRISRQTPWSDLERDDSAGGALPEHREAHDRGRFG